MAFCAELNALKDTASGPDGVITDTDATVSEFFAKRKDDVAAITEVSALYVPDATKSLSYRLLQHAQICATWEKNRNADRSTVLSDVRVKRFEE